CFSDENQYVKKVHPIKVILVPAPKLSPKPPFASVRHSDTVPELWHIRSFLLIVIILLPFRIFSPDKNSIKIFQYFRLQKHKASNQNPEPGISYKAYRELNEKQVPRPDPLSRKFSLLTHLIIHKQL